MRFFKNHSSAASATSQTPFGGLGFAMDSVQAVAQEMTLTPHRESGSDVTLPTPDYAVQPSGYELLVTLGCEIRGR